MPISINDHVDGDDIVRGGPGGPAARAAAAAETADAAAAAAVRAAGARAWSRADARLERIRSRLDQPRRVLLRDFLIFEGKLFLDGLKGLILSPLAVAAFLLDMLRPRGMNVRAFYRVMDVGERLDVWLSLYGASRHAADDPEGLLGESREGSPTMLGQLEHIVHRVVVGEHAEGELYPRSRTTGEARSSREAPEPRVAPASETTPAAGTASRTTEDALPADADPAPDHGELSDNH